MSTLSTIQSHRMMADHIYSVFHRSAGKTFLKNLNITAMIAMTMIMLISLIIFELSDDDDDMCSPPARAWMWNPSRSINLANFSYPHPHHPHHRHHHHRTHHHHHHDHHYHYQNQHELLLLSAHWATDWIDLNSDVSLYNVYIVRINLFLIQGSLSS